MKYRPHYDGCHWQVLDASGEIIATFRNFGSADRLVQELKEEN